MPTTEELLQQLAALEKQLAQTKAQKPVTSSRIKRVNNTVYIPHSMTGEALKAADQYTEEQMLEFKIKNLRKRARELRDTAAWNISEAEKLEAQAKDVDNELQNLKLL